MPKHPTVYMQTNNPHGTLYVGVTAYPRQRNHQHATGKGSTFTTQHNLKTLVWFESHATMADAIAREKQLKSWPRHRKLALIEAINPTWQNLADSLPYND